LNGDEARIKRVEVVGVLQNGAVKGDGKKT
jgi:hypothetical protein